VEGEGEWRERVSVWPCACCRLAACPTLSTCSSLNLAAGRSFNDLAQWRRDALGAARLLQPCPGPPLTPAHRDLSEVSPALGLEDPSPTEACPSSSAPPWAPTRGSHQG